MKIALLGFGREGQAALGYWRHKEPDATFVVYDEKEIAERPRGVEVITGPIDAVQIEADLVVRCSPPIAPYRIRTAAPVTTPTNEFFANCPAPIIGVTGTKGKGTTCSFIASILRAAGKTVHLVGNIGVPAIAELGKIAPDDIVVFELSSFQLWDAKFSPRVAVVLGIEPDHLDVHKDYDEYLAAKHNIVAHQKPGDIAYVHPTNPDSHRVASGAPELKKYADVESVSIELNKFCTQREPICDVENVVIPGAHNLENACAAIAAALNFTQDFEAIGRGLREFKGLPHRLEFVAEVGGVSYYDDSFSTTPNSTIVALKSFMQPINIILGGYDKGADFTQLAQELHINPHIKKAFLIGQTRHLLAAELQQSDYEVDYEVHDTDDLSEVINSAAKQASAGDIVLLSPACASFGMFKNVYDRGDQFQSIVKDMVQ